VLVHGTADPIVPYQWSVDTAAALQKHGVPAVLESLKGQGHVPYFEPYKSQIVSQAEDFFYFALHLGHAHGQSASTRRAFDRQVRAFAKSHPQLARKYKRWFR
jgi:acetyl esterase/lipase